MSQSNSTQCLRGPALCQGKVCIRCAHECPAGMVLGLLEVAQCKVDNPNVHEIGMGELGIASLGEDVVRALKVCEPARRSPVALAGQANPWSSMLPSVRVS